MSAWRVPAGELEQLVRERIAAWLSHPQALVARGASSLAARQLAILIDAAGTLGRELAECSTSAALRDLLLTCDAQVQIDREQVVITLTLGRLVERLVNAAIDTDERCTIAAPANLVRRGYELRLVMGPPGSTSPAKADPKLVELLAKGETAYQRLTSGGGDLGKTEREHLTRLARLKYLAPDIVGAILDGSHPVQLTARALLRRSELPIGWAEQRTVLGFG